MSIIRALIFDFDGVIVETEEPAFQAWQEVFTAHGQTLPLESWADRVGRPQGVLDPCEELESLLGRPLDRVAVRERRDRRKGELVAALPPLPGVRDYLAAAQALGLRVAIASSSPRAWIVDHLTRLGLGAEFACIRSIEDVAAGKPDPALFLAVLATLDVRPDEALVLEDSPNGIRAAHAAEIRCVAIPNPITGRLDLSAADLQIPSLAAVPLPALLRRLHLTPPSAPTAEAAG